MTSTLDRPTDRSTYRVPPHSREAEESVLGAVLLSDVAANEVMDKLIPEDFYVPAHQSIFEAILTLYNTNQPLDAVTVSEELRRRGALDKIGGIGYLTRLLDVVPTASNIEYYATIVEEHGLRRSLIKAGGAVTDLAFRTEDEIAGVIDRAEQQVLGVAEKRASQDMLEVGPLFQEVIEHIETLEANGSDITGLATGFRDLDKMLAGLQPANLVVIAARPSMGKSALTLNIATNAAVLGKVVALFSLEMAKEEVVQRILCSVGRVDSGKLRSGQLGAQNWDRVVAAAGRMYKAPIFIDDSSVVTVTDIRAKCRRLQRARGLDLVVVDYLQLMSGSNRENRQQEIAEISRGSQEPGQRAQGADHRRVATQPLGGTAGGPPSPAFRPQGERGSGAGLRCRDVHLSTRVLPPRRSRQEGHGRGDHRQASGRCHRLGRHDLPPRFHALRRPGP